MRIVHVSCWDTRGGAAIATSRLHLGLLEKGVDSHLLCARRQSSLPNTHLISEGLTFQKDRCFQALTQRMCSRQKDPTSFGCSANYFGNALVQRLHDLQPDIVHLHWVGASTAATCALKHITYPIVWTLHDMWPFCGAEHYDVTDERRYIHGYTPENRPEGAAGLDINRWVWGRKMHHWQGLCLHFVGVSNWISQCCRESAIYKNLSRESSVTTIHNGLDRTVFRPIPKAEAKANLGLNSASKLIAFGAFNAASAVKGGDLLLRSLEVLNTDEENIEIAIFGASSTTVKSKIPTLALGSIRDPKQMAMVYSAADLILVPSRIESFGQTASEAIACGTPVVCFDTSGLRDIVKDGVNGARVIPYDTDAYALEVKNWLESATTQEEISQGAECFDLNKVVEQHIALYREVI